MPEKNVIPEMLRQRLLSVRAFDASGMIIDADVIEPAPSRIYPNPDPDDMGHVTYDAPILLASLADYTRL